MQADIEAYRNRKEYDREKVVQLSLDNEFIAMYDSMKQAAETIGIWQSSIADVCKKKCIDSYMRQTAGGYRWMYYNNYRNQNMQKV